MSERRSEVEKSGKWAHSCSSTWRSRLDLHGGRDEWSAKSCDRHLFRLSLLTNESRHEIPSEVLSRTHQQQESVDHPKPTQVELD